MTRAVAALVVVGACSAPANALPETNAAQSFRPLSALFFLPKYAPPASGEVPLVPDSKIAWDLQVVARSLGLTGVEVTVNEQIARLRGTVPSVESKEALLRVTSKSRGVRQVVDTVEVRP